MTDYTVEQRINVQRDMTHLSRKNDDGSLTVLIGGDTADALTDAMEWVDKSASLSIRHTYGLRTMQSPQAWLWAGAGNAGEIHIGTDLVDAILNTIHYPGR